MFAANQVEMNEERMHAAHENKFDAVFPAQ